MFPLPLWNFSEKYRKKTENNVAFFSSNGASKKLSTSRHSWSKHDTGLSNLVFMYSNLDCSGSWPFMYEYSVWFMCIMYFIIFLHLFSLSFLNSRFGSLMEDGLMLWLSLLGLLIPTTRSIYFVRYDTFCTSFCPYPTDLTSLNPSY